MSKEPALQARTGRGYRRSPGQDKRAVQMAPIALIQEQNRAAVRPAIVRRGQVLRCRPGSGRRSRPATTRRRSRWAGHAMMPRPCSGRAAACRGWPEHRGHGLCQSAASPTRPTSAPRRAGRSTSRDRHPRDRHLGDRHPASDRHVSNGRGSDVQPRLDRTDVPCCAPRRPAAPVRLHKAGHRHAGDRNLEAGTRTDRTGRTQPAHANALPVTAPSATARKTTS
jgi:hypothetical protein